MIIQENDYQIFQYSVLIYKKEIFALWVWPKYIFAADSIGEIILELNVKGVFGDNVAYKQLIVEISYTNPSKIRINHPNKLINRH